MPTELNTPITKGGLQHIPFFNGRVLTAEDLKTEQKAHATERYRLGRAVGSGVIEGLFVRSGTEPEIVRVGQGLALAPSGRVVELPSDVELLVVSEIDREATAGTTGEFDDCSAQEVVVTSGTGAYLLFAEPAAEPRGRTPRMRLGGDGAAGECGAQYRLEGARLRLVHLDASDPTLVPDSVRSTIQTLGESVEDRITNGDSPPRTEVSRLRNLLAHVCLGTPNALAESATLYDILRKGAQREEASQTDPVDVLRERTRAEDVGLEDAVPIGLLYWARDRVLFVDVWAVRRRVHRRYAHTSAWSPDRRRARGEAAFSQFQAHLGSLIGPTTEPDAIERIEALSFFSFLPSAGVIPIRDTESDAARPPFLRGLTYRSPVFIEGQRVRPLLSASWEYSGIEVSETEMLWTYQVRENEQRPADERVRYVIFTSAYLPYQGDALYDAARWGYSNYGPGINRTPTIRR